MEKSLKSPFQVIDWRVSSFNYQNQRIEFGADDKLHWNIKVRIEKEKNKENIRTAILLVEFNISDGDAHSTEISGICLSLCKYNAIGDKNPDETFDRLMRITAVMNSFGNLRVFLLNQSLMFDIPKEKLVLPFIDLNKFDYDKGNEFET